MPANAPIKVPERWLFRLYINPRRSDSPRLIETLQNFCQRFIKEDGLFCEVRIIDVVAEPSVAMRDRILATPTLCFNGARRAQRIVGAFSEVDLFRICFLNPLRVRTRENGPSAAQVA